MSKRSIYYLSLFLFASLFFPSHAFAGTVATGNNSISLTLLFLAILLLAAKLGALVEKIGQPAVLGELGAGIGLAFLAYLGFSNIAEMRENNILAFLAEFGAILLLFQIGLESELAKMAKVGLNAFVVAVIGVVVPFVLGAFVFGPMLFPNIEFSSYLFIGAALVATSVGITAYVFQEMNMLRLRAAQTVLGAAVIDDVLGLLILAVVSAIATQGSVNPSFLVVLATKAFGFLTLAILLGNILANTLSKLFSRINTKTGMKLALALVFALGYAYIATLVGLAPIVGAFAAGLILTPVHFKSFQEPAFINDLRHVRGFNKKDRDHIEYVIQKHSHSHVEELVRTIGLLFIPLFFVHTGLLVDFASFLNPQLYIGAGILTIVAVLGKVIAGIGAKGEILEKALVGISMVPRGEVGLIFASAGRALGVVNDTLFSTMLLVIIATTFISPPLIKKLLTAYRGD